MSRIGKKPIAIPPKVEVKLNGHQVMVKGPRGSLELILNSKVKTEITDKEVIISVNNSEDKEEKSLWGLSRSLVNNMIEGVVNSFSKQLEINGIGYKASVQGHKLILNVGYSHPVEYEIPQGIEIKVEKNVITITGIDKQQVGQVAAEIRSIRKPEPYKGKGIKYIDEIIRRKVGKAVKGSEG
ncbi:50S ribosomal protein L6 [Patescibacteria group bacterium]|nr:50S ribosomal protein L6 [Patescibacteria group bacterium]